MGEIVIFVELKLITSNFDQRPVVSITFPRPWMEAWSELSYPFLISVTFDSMKLVAKITNNKVVIMPWQSNAINVDIMRYIVDIKFLAGEYWSGLSGPRVTNQRGGIGHVTRWCANE